VTTSTDRTWAVRIEAKGLEPVVQGPFTREQADALLGIYLDADREDSFEFHSGTTGRRITCEEFDPADRDLSEVIPEGEERYHWPSTLIGVAACVFALFLARHTYHLQFVTPRPQDAEFAVLLAFVGALFLFLFVGDALTRAWDRVLWAWGRSSRRKQAVEVTS
jgi:hypothetical protein